MEKSQRYCTNSIPWLVISILGSKVIVSHSRLVGNTEFSLLSWKLFEIIHLLTMICRILQWSKSMLTAIYGLNLTTNPIHMPAQQHERSMQELADYCRLESVPSARKNTSECFQTIVLRHSLLKIRNHHAKAQRIGKLGSIS